MIPKPDLPAETPLILSLVNEAATVALARCLAALGRPGDVVALWGDLGAGKTAFARAFIQARGSLEEVPSPTFTLVQTYGLADLTIWHFDLFRLTAPEEAIELGLDDAFAEGLSLIEWPDRLGGFLPDDRLDIALSFGTGDGSRQAAITAHGTWRRRLAEAQIDDA